MPFETDHLMNMPRCKVGDKVTIDAEKMNNDQEGRVRWMPSILHLKIMVPNFKNTTFIVTDKYEYNINDPDEEAVSIKPIKDDSVSYRKVAYDGTTRYQVKTKWLKRNAQFELGQEIKGKEKANLFDLM